MLWVSVGLAAISAAAGVALQLVPDSVGELAFGDNWGAAQEIALPLSIGFVALGVCFGPLVGLRALQQARTIVVCSVAQVVVSGIGFIAGALVDDAAGAALGQSIGVGLTTVVWWRAFTKAAASTPLPGPDPSPDALAAEGTIVLEEFDTLG